MLGRMTVLEKTYPITNAKLHLPREEETRLMYLYVEAAGHGGFRIWRFDLTRLEGPDGLDGQRLHTRWPGEAFQDDTLGTDTTGVEDVTDLNYMQVDGENYFYTNIQVDFTRVESRQYHVEACLQVRTEEDFGNDVTATADLVVTADENNPWADTR